MNPNRGRALPLLLAALLVSGCLAQDPNPEAPRCKLTDHPLALLEPICQQETTAPQDAASSSITYAEPVSLDDSLPAVVIYCTPSHAVLPQRCAGKTLDGRPAAVLRNLTAGNHTHAHLTITWNATSPVTRELYAALYAVGTTKSGDDDLVRLTPTHWGPSPLVVEAPLAEHDATQPLVLAAIAGGTLLPEETGYHGSHPEQPFHVEGNLTITTSTP